MKLDPKEREGKGRFSDEAPTSEPDSSFIDETLHKAGSRTTLFDMLFMLVVGFWNTVRGLFAIEGEIKMPGDKES